MKPGEGARTAIGTSSATDKSLAPSSTVLLKASGHRRVVLWCLWISPIRASNEQGRSGQRDQPIGLRPQRSLLLLPFTIVEKRICLSFAKFLNHECCLGNRSGCEWSLLSGNTMPSSSVRSFPMRFTFVLALEGNHDEDFKPNYLWVVPRRYSSMVPFVCQWQWLRSRRQPPS